LAIFLLGCCSQIVPDQIWRLDFWSPK
jgi:hypothetical protein